MPVKSSGSLSFSEIQDEFGPSKNTEFSLGGYRIQQNYSGADPSVFPIPLDDGIPSTGAISFSDFYDKRLNIVVDFFTGGLYNPVPRVTSNAKNKFINRKENEVLPVGGYIDSRTLGNSDTAGRKVIIHINDTIISRENNDINYCAFRSGDWASGTDLRIDVGSSGFIYGAGGPGGNGANSQNDGAEDGRNGNSAIGIEYDGECLLTLHTGAIAAGGGGGGGGGGAGAVTNEETGDPETGGGGGGGGGAGYPSGRAGLGGGGSLINDGDDGDKPSNGDSQGGFGGGGGSPAGSSAEGGSGGDGGDFGTGGESGSSGSGSSTSPRGSGGDKGYWLVHNSSNLNYILTEGTSQVYGNVNSNGSPAN